MSSIDTSCECCSAKGHVQSASYLRTLRKRGYITASETKVNMPIRGIQNAGQKGGRVIKGALFAKKEHVEMRRSVMETEM